MSYRLFGLILGHLRSRVLHTTSGVQPRLIAGVPFSVRRVSGISSPNSTDEGGEPKLIESYWGVPAIKAIKEDGTVWKWNCFRPWETYQSDLSIDMKKHHVPTTFLDKVAFWTVKSLRYPTDIFFQRRYGCRAMMLETVAAVPGMVGGMLLHLRSLRRFEHSGGWIKALLEEAENERMHLMTFMEVAKPKWYERALVIAVQGVFFNAYFAGYLISPKFAHRVVGYLEEEAIHSYTEFLKEIDKGNIENVPAPSIAVDYWRLPKTATLKDVVMVVRADEAHHRDVNHLRQIFITREKYSQLGKDGLLAFLENFLKDHFLPAMFVDYRKCVQKAISNPAAFRPRVHTTVYNPSIEAGAQFCKVY